MINLYKTDIYLLRDPEGFARAFNNPKAFQRNQYVLTKEEFQKWVIKFPSEYHKYIETETQRSKQEIEGIGTAVVTSAIVKHSIPPNETLLVTEALACSLSCLPNKTYTPIAYESIYILVGDMRVKCMVGLYERVDKNILEDENTKWYKMPYGWPSNRRSEWAKVMGLMGEQPVLHRVGIDCNAFIDICRRTERPVHETILNCLIYWSARLRKGGIQGLTVYSPPNEATIKRFLLDNPDISVKYDS